MARTLRDSALDTRAARGRLSARGKPYYRQIEEGLHLGYRKARGRKGRPSAAGKWVIRHYIGAQRYAVETIGTADDFSDADGVAVLSFQQAQQGARAAMVQRAHAAAGKVGPLTVADAMDVYLEFLENNRKSAYDARSRDKLHIRPELGGMDVESLTAERLRRWHAGLGRAPKFVRVKEGDAAKHVPMADTDDARRARRASANRTLTTLKAALNRLWRDGKVSSDAAWRRVEPFQDVDAARVRYLTVAEGVRLINACDDDFRYLTQAALQTGARYGELIRLQVHDFNPDAGTVAIRQSKSGKPRHVVLTEEGTEVFRRLCAGRAGGELMFRKNDGGPWLKSHQVRPMVAACERAKIKPAIGFHGLRHTWASLAVMNGVPLLVVAKNLGHKDTRMVEKHYGHLAPSYVADAIRAGAPKFGLGSTNVVAVA